MNLEPIKCIIMLVGIFTFFVYIILAIVGVNKNYYDDLFFFNLLFSIIYLLIILISLKSNYFGEDKLFLYVLLYSIVGVLAYNYFFYKHSGTFLGFNPMDSALYYYTAIDLSKKSIWDMLNIFSHYSFNIDDLGYPIYSAIIYKIIPSNIAVNFVNLIFNTLTTILLYRIGKNFISNKLAFTCSLIYGISSYSIFYQASGLKETLLVFLIISSFYYYTKYIKYSKPLYLYFAIIIGLSIIFLRVALVVFILFSYFINEMVKRRNNIKIIFPIILFSSILILFFINYFEYINKFLRTKDFILLIKSAESSYISANTEIFAYSTALLSGIVGPFPTILPIEGKEALSVYASGLILKIFLSSYFLFSIRFAWIHKNYIVLPIIFFCLMEIIGLSYLLESFEVRKAMPHIGLFLIASFYSYEQIHNRYKSHRRIKNSILIINSVFAVMIILWNVLRT